MVNIYYSPEKFGLEPVGEIDWSSGCFEFDYTTVWRDVETGNLYYGEDAGCSCPSPFEDVRGINDLTLIRSAAEFQTHLRGRLTNAYHTEPGTDGEMRALVATVRDLLSSETRRT